MFDIKLTNPGDDFWEEFLDLSVKYFKENWPSHYNGTDSDGKLSYHKLCLQRKKEGGRFFFCFYQNGKCIGNANIYILSEGSKAILNVAEFYIVPAYRKLKLGTHAALRLFQYSFGNPIDEIRVDVDKNQIGANRFWASGHLGLVLDSRSERNVYHKELGK